MFRIRNFLNRFRRNRSSGTTGYEPSLGGNRASTSKDAVQLGGIDAMLHLLKNVDNPDQQVRRRAIREFNQLGRMPVYDMLIPKELQTYGYDEKKAVRILGKLRDARAIPLLGMRLNNNLEQMALRRAALRALRKIGDPAAIPVFRETLLGSDRNDELCQLAADALKELGDYQLVADLLRRGSQGDWAAIQGLGYMKDPRSVPPLLQLMREHPNEFIRSEAARTLGKIGDRRALGPVLEELRLSFTDEWSLVEGLGELGGSRAVDAVIEWSRSQPEFSEDGPHLVAVPVLGQLADPRAIHHIALAFRKKSGWPGLRQDAVAALSKIGGPDVVTPLIDAMSDEEFEVRRDALEALGKLYPLDERIPTLVLLCLNDPHQQVRRNAAKILGKYRVTNAVSALIHRYRMDRPMVQKAARKALEQIGTPDALAAINPADA